MYAFQPKYRRSTGDASHEYREARDVNDNLRQYYHFLHYCDHSFLDSISRTLVYARVSLPIDEKHAKDRENDFATILN